MRYLSARFFLLLVLLLPLPALAETAFDYRALAQVPVASDGRLKPLSSFARQLLIQLKGNDADAMAWLANAVFDPATAPQQRCFRVANPHVRAMLALPERRDKTYTLLELAPGLERTADQAEALSRKDAKDLSADEQALFALHTNVLVYGQLLQTLSLVLPLPAQVPAALQGMLAQNELTYLAAMRVEMQVAEAVRSFIDKIAPEQFTPEQQQLASFMLVLQRLRQSGEGNQLFRVIPSSWNSDWLSPWAVLLSGQGSPETAQLLQQWRALALAYQAGEADVFTRVSEELRRTTLAAQPDATLAPRLVAEQAYTRLHPYGVSGVLLALAVLLAVPLAGRSRPRAGWLALLAGLLVLVMALGTRIYILQRPPVGTLYESVLFVALVVGGCGVAAGWRGGRAALIAAAAAGAGLLLAVAPFLADKGESLNVLSAVLNTNLWLTVHVLCITAGYGACLITALLAHVLLARPQPVYEPLLHRLAILSLLLTATGTLLGGVWADQSWGRFWGWDPKENGALLIVLWLAWLLHARMGGQLSARAVTAGLAALSVVVAQAWFGVNLLSVGLHSYGFISGVATALFAFTALELALIAWLWRRAVLRGS